MPKRQRDPASTDPRPPAPVGKRRGTRSSCVGRMPTCSRWRLRTRLRIGTPHPAPALPFAYAESQRRSRPTRNPAAAWLCKRRNRLSTDRAGCTDLSTYRRGKLRKDRYSTCRFGPRRCSRCRPVPNRCLPERRTPGLKHRLPCSHRRRLSRWTRHRYPRWRRPANSVGAPESVPTWNSRPAKPSPRPQSGTRIPFPCLCCQQDTYQI
jgi:hypothetical protein